RADVVDAEPAARVRGEAGGEIGGADRDVIDAREHSVLPWKRRGRISPTWFMIRPMAAKRLVTIGALVLLASCGGGGGGGGSAAGGPAGFVYVTNEASETVSVYAIDAGTGALTPIAASPFPTRSQPLAPALDPSRTFAY